jgi:predicted PurR-regulated permease PerM
MENKNFRNKTFFLIAIGLGLTAFIAFLITTQIAFNPVFLFIISLFLIIPFRNDSPTVRRIILLIVMLFIMWLLSSISNALIAFGISFLLAYLFDPIVNMLSRKGIPRWLSAMSIIVIFMGIVTVIAVFVFPSIFMQIGDITKKITNVVTTATSYLEGRKVTKLYDWIGISDQSVKTIIQTEFLPEVKQFIQKVMDTLLNLLKGMSFVASQLLNAILIPVFSFYFLKDFNKIKEQLKIILGKKDRKLLFDLRRINDIFRIYIGWQIIAASMVATVCSIVFTIAGISNGILLGILCGFLNPIPYIGLLLSWILSSLIIIVLGPDNMLYQILVIIITVNVLHFVNAYFVEPNILGKRIGLHPIILFASLFIFGAIFGFVGLLIAVPCTATLILFYNDWKNKIKEEEDQIELVAGDESNG